MQGLLQQFMDTPPAHQAAIVVVSAIALEILMSLLFDNRPPKPKTFRKLRVAGGVPFGIEHESPEAGTVHILLHDVLRLKDGGYFDGDFWPDGLGTEVRLQLQRNDDEPLAVALRIGENGFDGSSSNIRYSAMMGAASYEARKPLQRIKLAAGDRLKITGTITELADTNASLLELELAR